MKKSYVLLFFIILSTILSSSVYALDCAFPEYNDPTAQNTCYNMGYYYCDCGVEIPSCVYDPGSAEGPCNGGESCECTSCGPGREWNGSTCELVPEFSSVTVLISVLSVLSLVAILMYYKKK